MLTGTVRLEDGCSAVTIFFTGKCEECSESVQCSYGEIALQREIGDDYEDGGEGGALQCKSKDC